LTFAMIELSDFIDLCNLIDPPLERAHFTWSSHEEVLVLFQIDRFCLQVKRIIAKECTRLSFLRLPHITFQFFSRAKRLLVLSVFLNLKICG